MLLALSAKWILITLLFPFQVLYQQYQLRKPNRLWAVMAGPYWLWERFVTRRGWQRYMLVQVGMIPSCHLRRLIYRLLGVTMGPRNIFHYRLELRHPQFLKLGGG